MSPRVKKTEENAVVNTEEAKPVVKKPRRVSEKKTDTEEVKAEAPKKSVGRARKATVKKEDLPAEEKASDGNSIVVEAEEPKKAHRQIRHVVKTKKLEEKEKNQTDNTAVQDAPAPVTEEPVVTNDVSDDADKNNSKGKYNRPYNNHGYQNHDNQQKNPDLNVPTYSELMNMEAIELVKLAAEEGLIDIATHSKKDVVEQLISSYLDKQEGGYKLCSGVLDILADGYGFLRQESLLPSTGDVYVAQAQIKRLGLRIGDYIVGISRPNKEKNTNLVRVELINDINPEMSRLRPSFSQLTPIYPDSRITLETSSEILATRVIDLFAPIGRGQRGLIVAPPKAGKTMLLKAIANAVEDNYPDIHVMVCLIGERPEEVTDMRRSVRGEVIAATFDEAEENQSRVAELAIEKAKRMVELGKDVFLLLDGITRLTRAYNLSLPSSGRTLSGGIDPVALHPGKKFFGAARNVEDGGSLTIIATCLVDTGSRMDDLIYEEFKGTGNMELHLDRKLAERGTFPAVDITRSSTRRDEFLYSDEDYQTTRVLRRMVAAIATDTPNGSPVEASQRVLDSMKRTKDNRQFLDSVGKDRFKAV